MDRAGIPSKVEVVSDDEPLRPVRADLAERTMTEPHRHAELIGAAS
jgi:hypothetical protein